MIDRGRRGLSARQRSDRLDALDMPHPFHGSRRMVITLGADEHRTNRKRVQRLMRRMGLEGREAPAPKPGTSRAAPQDPVYPYLLRHLTIDRPNQV
jgi:putative transposase